MTRLLVTINNVFYNYVFDERYLFEHENSKKNANMIRY